MKQLILVRHGKSSWEYEVNDKDRPLIERGINDGHLVAAAFKNSAPAIDAVYSSPGIRALHTCVIFLRKLKIPMERFQLAEALYEFSGEGVMDFVHQLDDSLNTVMIFGHNNAFTNVAHQLGGAEIGTMPTAGLVHLEFTSDSWSTLSDGRTCQLIYPKELKE